MNRIRVIAAVLLLSAIVAAVPVYCAEAQDPEEIIKHPDHPAVKLSGDEPKYTEDAKRARIAGIVILEAVIERDGHVSTIRVVKPLPLGLDQTAIDAVYTWKFDPARDKGKIVRSSQNIPISFRPPKSEQQ